MALYFSMYVRIGLIPFTGTQDQNYFLTIDIYVRTYFTVTRYVCAMPTFTTYSFHHDTKCLYGKMTCTVKEGLYSTRSQTILNT